MGMQERDWYKKAWAKRDEGDFRGYHYGSSEDQPLAPISSPFSFWPWFKVAVRYLYYVLIGALVLRLFIKVFSGTYI